MFYQLLFASYSKLSPTTTLPSIKMRTHEVVYELQSYQLNQDPNGKSIAQRFVYWNIAWDI